MPKWNWLNRLFPLHFLPIYDHRRRGKSRSTVPALVETLENRQLLTQFIAAGTDVGVQAEVRILSDVDQNGTFETEATDLPGYGFHPFGNFTGGVRVAFGDFDGDDNDELVVAAGPGGGPHVMIYDLSSEGIPGAVLDSFFAYDAVFSGGLFVATGDLDRDGRDELIVSPDQGGGPHVKIFSDTDHDGVVSDNLTDELFPYGQFTGGVRLAVGDVDNDGLDELITAAGPGGGPHVMIFDNADLDRQVSDDGVLDSFFAYDASFTGGVYVAAARIQNAGSNGYEVVTAAGEGGGPHVKIFTDGDNDDLVSDEPVFEEFFAYDGNFTGGVRLAAGNTDRSESFDELITAGGPGSPQQLRIFDDNVDAGSQLSDNDFDDQRFPFGDNYSAGLFIATGTVVDSTFRFTGGPTRVPDEGGAFDPPTPPLTVSIFVPPSAGVVRDLDVSISISAFRANELDVRLRHVRTGIDMFLFTDVGDTRDGLVLRIDDEAAMDAGDIPADTSDRAFFGEVNPEGTAQLSFFDGIDASGEWQLIIDDDQSGGVSILYDWTLHISHE
ncbi:MAG: hypothetical protein KDA84_16220 [Planctomycetaceae bacterium]|nr:hypothetical protein [Planctomycetaceae bacterium]